MSRGQHLGIQALLSIAPDNRRLSGSRSGAAYVALAAARCGPGRTQRLARCAVLAVVGLVIASCATTSGIGTTDRLEIENASPDAIRVSIEFESRVIPIGRVYPLERATFTLRRIGLPPGGARGRIVVVPIGTPGAQPDNQNARAVHSDFVSIDELIYHAWRYSGSRIVPFRRDGAHRWPMREHKKKTSVEKGERSRISCRCLVELDWAELDWAQVRRATQQGRHRDALRMTSANLHPVTFLSSSMSVMFTYQDS